MAHVCVRGYPVYARSELPADKENDITYNPASSVARGRRPAAYRRPRAEGRAGREHAARLAPAAPHGRTRTRRASSAPIQIGA
jgi:hypothetical protein